MVCSWSVPWFYSFASFMICRKLNLISLYVSIIAKEALEATEEAILALSNNVRKRDSKDSFETCRNTINGFSKPKPKQR